MGKARRKALSYFNRYAPDAILTERDVMQVIATSADVIYDNPDNMWELDELIEHSEALFPGITKRLCAMNGIL